MTDIVKYFNNSELSINLTSILILNDQTNEFEPWFIAKEVATLLGYEKTKEAINRHVDELDQKLLSYNECKELFGQSISVDETVENTEDIGGPINGTSENSIKINNNGMKFINESGLYTLIARSDKREARKFQRWVTSEVLPSIRKSGQYNINQPAYSYQIDDLNRLEQALRTVKDILGKAEIESYAFKKYPDYDVTYAYSSAFHGITRVLKDLDDKLDEMNRMWEMPTDINETIVK